MKIINYLKNKFPWLSYAIGLIPFIAACIGYGYYGKLPVWQAVYASVALYFVNPVVDYESSLILFAEIGAVIVTAGIILSVVRYAYAKVDHFFIRFNEILSSKRLYPCAIITTDNGLTTSIGLVTRFPEIAFFKASSKFKPFCIITLNLLCTIQPALEASLILFLSFIL